MDWRVRKDKNPPRSLPQPHRDCHGTPCLATTQDGYCDEALPHNPYCLCEPFGFCHSEGEERPKNLAQGKLREAIQADEGLWG